MQVGTTKDQGLYNKPSALVHAGALTAGTLPQYNTVPCCRHAVRPELTLQRTCFVCLFVCLCVFCIFSVYKQHDGTKQGDKEDESLQS